MNWRPSISKELKKKQKELSKKEYSDEYRKEWFELEIEINNYIIKQCELLIEYHKMEIRAHENALKRDAERIK